jgi:hypothetical protein
MRTPDLCELIFREACEENSAFYRRMIEEESLDVIKDPLWKRIVTLARSLSDQDRETLIKFAKQVSVDAVSTVFGGIDGNTSLAGRFLSLSLVDGEGQQHAGDLQEEFLTLVHNREV